MRIALVTPGGVDRSGDERSFPYLLALIERLARRHDVQVFALHQEAEPSMYPLLGATVHNGGAHGRGRRRAYWRTFTNIVAEHRRSPFDLLHAFWLLPAGLIAEAAGLFTRRPVLVHLAGGEFASIPEIGYGGWVNARTRFWVRLGLAGASRLTAASRPLIHRAGEFAYQVERVPFGVDLARWPARKPQRRVAGGPARLLHVGDLNRVKDQPTLLKAAERLKASGVDFRLDMVGFDTLGGEIQALSARLGIENHVTFHGYLPPSRVRPLLEAAHVLVVSSRHEAGPFAMLEAAVAGVPTVGTSVGHVAEWAPDAAVAVRDGDALASAVTGLLGDEDRRLRVAREAQRRAVAEDADWTAQRVEALYAEMRA
ncbi:MAG: glycosyltransferase family 1 protein [Gemmatimonadetes bacterium]|nr:glycosyltransferase family 1 protein [Gemmatimonadota bacterium]